MAVNVCNIEGWVGSDAEMRYTPSGKGVASFRLGIPQGRDKPSAWVKCTVWGSDSNQTGNHDFAEWVNDNIRKGDHIQFVGRYTCDEYTGKDDGLKRLAPGFTITPWTINYVQKAPEDAGETAEQAAQAAPVVSAVRQGYATSSSPSPVQGVVTGGSTAPIPSRQRGSSATAIPQKQMTFARDDEETEDVPFF